MVIDIELATIEAMHDVHILYACEAGSRIWGFDSPDSDYDVRFIYCRPLEAYLLLDPPPDTIEKTVGDYDFVGWDIKKALGLLRKTNTNLLEWLASPTRYVDSEGLRDDMAVYSAMYHSPAAIRGHYNNMAMSNYLQYIRNPSDRSEPVLTKKYLYVINPIVKLLYYEQYREFPPLNLTEALAEISVPDTVREQILTIVDMKRSGVEMGRGPASISLNYWIEYHLEKFSSPDHPLRISRDQDTRVLNEILLKMLKSRVSV